MLEEGKGEEGKSRGKKKTHLLVVRLLNTLLGDNSIENELNGDSTGNSDGKSLGEEERKEEGRWSARPLNRRASKREIGIGEVK